MNAAVFRYGDNLYPDYIRRGNAMRFIAPAAQQFCIGSGLDVGAGDWPLPGAKPIELRHGGEAMDLPAGPWDYIFSSHCLEHLPNPVAALEHWWQRLRPGGVLFLYLPHPDMEYWRPEHCRKHLHLFHPEDMRRRLEALGFDDVIVSGRDIVWSFAAVGFRPEAG